MAGKYAASTDVPVSRSRDEIERTLGRFGAEAFGYMSDASGRVAVTFQINGLKIMMTMQLPNRDQFMLDSRRRVRTDSAIEKDWEQACRQRWRSLANGVKAKLALIDDGISTVEREFMSDIVLPNGRTIGDTMLPEIVQLADSGKMPQLPPITGRVE